MGQIVAPSGTWEPTISTWPWPQIRFLKNYTIGLAPNGSNLMAYELDISSDSWNASELQDLGALADIGQVEFIDYGAFFVMAVWDSTNDTAACYIRQPGIVVGVAGDMELVNNTNVPNFITGCDYNGQAIIAGLDSPDAAWYDVYRHSVAWAGIGTFDFRIFDNRVAGYSHTSEGQGGEGNLWKARQLGQGVLLYGSEGIFSMNPISQPVSSWSVPKNLGRVPPLHWNAIAGNAQIHYYIDENLDLWRLTSESVDKLSYKEYLQSLVASDILLVYEEQNANLYISDGNRSFVLTPQGLYECHQCVTSIGIKRDTLAGFFVDTAEYEGLVVTNTLDFFSRGFKSIQGLEIGSQSEDPVYGFVKYKNGNNPFSTSIAKQFTNDGVVMPIVAGVDLQVGIQVDDYRTADFSMDYMLVKVKYVDKRFKRGSYAPSEAS